MKYRPYYHVHSVSRQSVCMCVCACLRRRGGEVRKTRRRRQHVRVWTESGVSQERSHSRKRALFISKTHRNPKNQRFYFQPPAGLDWSPCPVVTDFLHGHHGEQYPIRSTALLHPVISQKPGLMFVHGFNMYSIRAASGGIRIIVMKTRPENKS